MPLNKEDVFRITRETVINSITRYAALHLNDVRNFQILDLIMPKERKIRSIVGGLETSLGTTLWEPLAKNLAQQNNFTLVNQDLQTPAIMPADLQNTLQILTNGRINRNRVYTATHCHDRIKEICQTFIDNPIPAFIKAPRGYGVDVWLVRDGVNYFFDTKTVQPNVGSFSRYFSQVLNWYAYYYSQNPNGQAEARIVFPYNPYQGDFWNNSQGRGWPLEKDSEGWVEDQFWDFCSGVENSYQIIHAAFVDIATTGDLQEILDGIFSTD